MAVRKAAKRRPAGGKRRRAVAKKRTTARAKAGPRVLVMVGTMKGAFFFWSDARRRSWSMDGPHFPGETVYAMAYDGRGGRRRILAAPRSWHWGAVIRTSDDFGKNWTSPKGAARR
jgi:hypothetical protein